MRNKEEYNAYMKAYMQNKRDNMTFEEWRAFRDKNNAYHKKIYDNRTPEQIIKHKEYHKKWYDNRTPEQIEKHKEYQRNKHKLYYYLKKGR